MGTYLEEVVLQESESEAYSASDPFLSVTPTSREGTDSSLSPAAMMLRLQTSQHQ